MKPALDGKIALVTGAGRGIGRAIALKLASEGARLVINDLDADPAQECIDAVRAAGGEAVACVGNIIATDFPERFIATALNQYKGIDIIVNNAGYTWDNVIQKMTDEQWYAMIDCHLTAPFRLLRAAQPVIRNLLKEEMKGGKATVRKVVNISSTSGIVGYEGQVNYSSAKAGVIGMTRTLAKEWGRLNVTVNCVAFGYITTRLTAATANEGATARIEGRDIRIGVNPALMDSILKSIPLGRPGMPEDAAGAVYMFCIPESNYVSGQTIICAGGFTG